MAPSPVVIISLNCNDFDNECLCSCFGPCIRYAAVDDMKPLVPTSRLGLMVRVRIPLPSGAFGL